MCRACGSSPARCPRTAGSASDTTSCTGLCDQGPALLVNGRAIGRLTAARIDAIVDADPLARRRSPSWPARALRRRRQRPPRATCCSLARARVGRGDGARRARVARTRPPRRSLDEIEAARTCAAAAARASRPASSGRRAARRRAHALRRLQRRRGRAGHFQGPRAAREPRRPGVRRHDGLRASRSARRRASSTCAANTATCGAPRGGARARGATAGLLGRDDRWARPGFDFDIEIHLGAGAYVCGEESALIESLEGKRGIPRNRPPFPVTHGYLGQPTVVNNVETLLPPRR